MSEPMEVWGAFLRCLEDICEILRLHRLWARLRWARRERECRLASRLIMEEADDDHRGL